MKGMGVLIGFAAVAGLVLASTSKSGGAAPGASQTIDIKAGETWMVTVKAVGGTLGETDEAQIRQMAPSFGTLQSLVRSQDGKMLVYVLTYSKPTKIITNQLIALTTAPDRGLMITDATPLPSGGPALAESTRAPAEGDIIARAGDVYFLRVATLAEPVPADEALMKSLFPGAREGLQRLSFSNGRVLDTFTLKLAEDKRWPAPLTPIASDAAGHGVMIMEALKRS